MVMLDINGLIRELDQMIVSLTSASGAQSPGRRMGLVGVDVSLTVRSLDLGGTGAPGARKYGREASDPLVDVIEGRDTIRVIALLPGIKSEDVRYSIGDGYLDLEIFNGTAYRKRIPCSARPEEVHVKSTTLNNSVLEIIFSKR